MGGVQQPGVVRLLKALTPVLTMPAVQVGAVDQPGPAGGAGPGGDQRGHRDPLGADGSHLHHRGAAAAAPGAAPGRPRALAGLISKQSQAPRSATVPLSPARSPPARRRWRPRPARPPGGPGPVRSSRSGAAAHPARPACTRSRTARAPARRSGPTSSTGPATPRRPGRHPAPPRARAAAPGSACTEPRRPLGDQRLLPASRQCAPPPVR